MLSKCVLAVCISLTPLGTWAGECRVANPKDEVLIDASRLALLLEVELFKVSQRYLAETGRKLEVVLVSRAGQDLRQAKVLKDFDPAGQPQDLKAMFDRHSASPYACRDLDCSTHPPDLDKVRSLILENETDSARTLRFSHVGFFTKDHPFANERTHIDGSKAPELQKFWWSSHLLRPCLDEKTEDEVMREAQSDLSIPYIYSEGPINFFADNPYELKFKILVPTPDIHDRLVKLANQVAYDFAGEPLASFRYNVAGHYLNPIEGNSAAFILETLVAALEPEGHVTDRVSAQRALIRRGYRPTRIAFSGVKFGAAGLPFSHKFAPFFRLHTDEQPFFRGLMMSELVTELSVEEFMRDQGVLWDSIVVEGPGQKTTVEEARAIRLRAEQLQKPKH